MAEKNTINTRQEKYFFNGRRYESLYTRLAAALLILAQALALCPVRAYAEDAPRSVGFALEEASEVIRAEEGGVVRLGDAEIQIPAGALKRDTEIKIQRLPVTRETGEMLANVTAGGGGYRFLPAGQRFRKAATIRIGYGEEMDGKPAAKAGMRSYYYDEKKRRWEGLELAGVDEERRQVVSLTTHFTDMINGTLSMPEGPKPLSHNINSIKGLEAADPSAGVPAIEGLEGGSTGAAGFRIAVAVPPGRAGMTPGVAVTYSSDGGNGVMGKGFSLQAGGEITYDTRRGLPYYENSAGGNYLLDGVMLEQIDPVDVTTYRYRPLKESGFEQILHYTGTENYWTVTDKRGTTRVYGRRSGTDTSGASWTGPDDGGKYRWLLESVTDVFGNQIRYEYNNEDGEAYLTDIRYTGTEGNKGPYNVHFEYGIRTDISVNGRGKFIAQMKQRLQKIETKYNNRLIRRYLVEYLDEQGDEGAKLAQELFGVSRVVKLGEASSKKSEKYHWAYEFNYEDWGTAKELFGEVKSWPAAGPIQEKEGTSGGGSFTGSAGFGVGSAFDVRGVFAGHFASSSGDTDTKWTLADINGDGKPDRVKINGNNVFAYLNNGNGFDSEAVLWSFTDGSGPSVIGRDAQNSSNTGYSVYGGASYRNFSFGITYGRTTQENWSKEEIGFADINGDGLIDIVEKGKNYYWQNTGDEGKTFKLTNYGGEGLPGDVERELQQSDIYDYDEAYYQQAPLRQWRIPYDGTVVVGQNIQPALENLTEDGVRTYIYKGGSESPLISKYNVGTGKQPDETLAMKAGESLFFVSDAGNDIRSDKNVSSDITWNINIHYTRMRYFEAMDRQPAFFLPQQFSSMDNYGSMPRRLQEYYKAEETTGNNAVTYYEATANLNSERGWLNEETFEWVVRKNLVIPGILTRGGFETLKNAAEEIVRKRKQEQQNRPPEAIESKPEALSAPIEALFSYYRYDAGRKGYYLNEPGRRSIKAEEWKSLESQMLTIMNALDFEKRRELFSATLPGREEQAVPRYDAGKRTWYYGEAAQTPARYQEGGILWYKDRGRTVYLDRYGENDLLFDTATNKVWWGNELIGEGTFTSDGTDAAIQVSREGMRQDWYLQELQVGRTRLSLEEAAELGIWIAEWDWLEENEWKRISREQYDALVRSAPTAREGLLIRTSYQADAEGKYALQSPGEADRETLRRRIGVLMKNQFFSCYETEETDGGAAAYRLRGALGGIQQETYDLVNSRLWLQGWTKVTRSIRYFSDIQFAVENNRLDFLAVNENGEFEPYTVDITNDYSWDSGKDFNTEDAVSDGIYYDDAVKIDMRESKGDDEKLESQQVKRYAETVEALYGGHKQWYYGFWYGGQEAAAGHYAAQFKENALYSHREKARNKEKTPFKKDDAEDEEEEDTDEEDETGTGEEVAAGTGEEVAAGTGEEVAAGTGEEVAAGTDEEDEADTDEEDEPARDKDNEARYARADTARELAAGVWTIKTDDGSVPTQDLIGNDVLIGPIFVTVDKNMNDKRYAPWIKGDRLHTSRAGGETYRNLPGVLPAPKADGSMAMGSINSSYSKGDDKVWTYGLGVKFEDIDTIDGAKSSAGANYSRGTNSSTTRTEQSVQDINGDGYADIVQYNGSGFKVTPGKEGAFGGNYTMTGGGYLSKSTADTTTHGVTLSASGGVTNSYTSGGHMMSQTITGGGGNGVTWSEGGSYQSAGLIDMNGDGLPDYFNDGIVNLNIGKEFSAFNEGQYGQPSSVISRGQTGSDGFSLSLSGGAGAQSKSPPGSSEYNRGAGATVSLSGSLNFSSSHTYNTKMFMDVNGDGIPDWVIREPGTDTIIVRFGTGSSFTEGCTFNLSGWGSVDNGEITLTADNAGSLPYFGSSFKGQLNANSAKMKSFIDKTNINALDYSGTYSFGIAGGVDINVQISFTLAFVQFNIPLSMGPGLTHNSFTSEVTVRTMDIDGDGLPDRVLSIPGSGNLLVQLNRSGRIGLLRTITLPQGGRYELDYKLESGTTRMPQSRYVLSSVTMREKTGYRQQPGSVHAYTTEYKYFDGYYDRTAREFYGFETVTALYADGGKSETKYYNDKYYRRGMVLQQTRYNETGTTALQTTLYDVDDAPYARVVRQRTEQREANGDGGFLATGQRYQYGDYGNVTELWDYAEGSARIHAQITYKNDFVGYLHAHPETIKVYEEEGRGARHLVRRRTGEYNEKGSLVSLKQYYGAGNAEYAQTQFAWDAYGNLAQVTTLNSGGRDSWVSYGYDTELGQYVETIQREGSGISGSYSSAIQWDKALGLKKYETDENGQVIEYKYDEYGRLKEVRSPYDGAGGIAAVTYEYHTETGKNWYTVTQNKVRFDASDKTVITTAVEADSLGRKLYAAKSGEKWPDKQAAESGLNGQTAEKGWNVSGAVEYDGKGRAVKTGQPYFVAGTNAAGTNAAGTNAAALLNHTVNMKNAAVKEYDTLDRVTKTRLPDKSTETTVYGIQGGRSYEMITDPLGNVSFGYRDGRGNTLRVEKRDKKKELLTGADYEYNALGEMLRALDAAGNPLTLTYDLLGRRLSMESADSGRSEWVYDHAGNVVEETNSELRKAGRVIKHEYDGMNRLVRTVYPYLKTAEYEYGQPDDTDKYRAGRLVRLTDSSGTTEYEYGKLGETVKERKELNKTTGGSRTKTAVFEYLSNYLGQTEKIVYPDGEEVVYGYDYGGNVSNVKGKNNKKDFTYVDKVGYNEFGQRAYLKLGNGIETTYTYNENRRWLQEIRTVRESTVMQNIKYSFNPVGNVKGYTNNAGGYQTKQTYTYDNLYQLTAAEGETTSLRYGLLEYTAMYSQQYHFDSQGLGNMTLKSSSTASSPPRLLGDPLNYQSDYEYEEGYAHRASRIGNKYYRYDLNGSVTGVQDSPFEAEAAHSSAVVNDLGNGAYYTEGGWALDDPKTGGAAAASSSSLREYRWDERNRMQYSGDGRFSVKYTYGEDGERTGKWAVSHAGGESETLYFGKLWSWHYDGIVGDYTGMNSTHIFLGDTRIATKAVYADGSFIESAHNEQQYYYHSDHLGSAQLITDYKGDEYERVEYTPYGELWIEKAAADSLLNAPYRFTGKERDKETGLYYYGARYLDPRDSRWLSVDPAVGEYVPSPGQEVGKLPGMGGVFNTVNLHVYHYAGNNPVKYVDPNGEFFGIDDAIGATIQCFKDGDWSKYGERFKSNFVNSWKLIGNTYNTFHDIHSFKDFANSTVQFIGRFTWGILGTVAGFLSGYVAIEGFGGQYSRFRNLSIIKTDGRPFGAFTLGHVSVGDKITLNDDLAYAHEYGHYMMSLLLGPLYISHAIASAYHAHKHGNADEAYFEYQTEREADHWGGVNVIWENGKIKRRTYP